MKLFSENINYALGWMVVHSLWQATIISLVFGIAIIALRKQSAKLRYWIANLGLFMVLCAAITTFSWYYYKINQPLLIDFATIQSNNSIRLNTGQTIAKIIPAPVSPTENAWSVANFRDYFDQNLPLIVTIWLMGVAVFMMRLLGGISYVYYLRTRMNFPPDEYWVEVLERLSQKANIKRSIELVESAMVRTPMVVGYLKPLILFPIGLINRLTEKEVEAILAHEIAHVLRNDYIFNILQSIVEALFYYHPAVWWISAQIRDEREMACDEIAIDLLGNSMNYAKALVLIQEIAFFPLTASLAFAGQNKSQFLTRIQRILNQPQNKSNIMEKLIATLIVLFTLIGLNIAQQNNPKYIYSNLSQNANIRIGESPMKTSGYWNATIENDEVCVTFNNSEKKNTYVSTECFKKSEFSSLPTQEAEFTLTRAAGTITFKGKFEGNEGYGKQAFVANSSFKKVLENKGIDDTSDEMMFFAFLSNTNETYFEQLISLGFNDIPSEKLKEAMIFRLDISTIKNYINAFKSKGYVINNLDEIINLKVQDIDVAYIEKMDKAMNKNLSPEEIMNSKIHDLKPENIALLENVTAEEMKSDDHLNFAIHGIDANFVKSMQEFFGKKISNEDILNAKIHGIDANFINSFKEFNFSDLNFENVLTLKIHGISPEFCKSIKNLGFKNISIEDLAGLKIYDISPEYIQEMRKKGYATANLVRFIELKIQDYEGYADGRGSFAPPVPAVPPTPPAPLSFNKNNQSFSSSNRENENFGHLKDSGMDTWFNGDYKIITKKNKIDKAYYQGKAMSSSEIAEMKDALEAMIDEIKDEKDNVSRSESSTLDAQSQILESERSALDARRAALNAQREILKSQRTLQNLNFDKSEGGGRMNDDKESKALSWFMSQLLAEKYYEIGKKTEFSITKKGMRVQGKNLSNTIFERYKLNIERILGKPISAKFKYYFKGKVNGVDGDKFNIDGEFSINAD